MSIAITLEDVVPFKPITLESLLTRAATRLKETPELPSRVRHTPIDEEILHILERHVLPDIRKLYPNLIPFNQSLATNIPVEAPNDKQFGALKSWLGYFFPDFGLPVEGRIDIYIPVREIGYFLKRKTELAHQPKEFLPKLSQMLYSASDSLSGLGVDTTGLKILAESPALLVRAYQKAYAQRKDFGVKFGGLIERLGYRYPLEEYFLATRFELIR